MNHHFVYTFVLFSSTIFFSVISVLGIPYDGAGSSVLYQFFCIVCFIIWLLTFIKDFTKYKHTKRHFISIGIIFIYALSGMASGFLSDRSFLSLVAFCLPASCVAMVYSTKQNISQLVKWLDVFVAILTFSLFFMSSHYFNDDTFNYSQSLSYFAAFGFLVDLFLLKYGDKYPRFEFFKTRFFRYISIMMLPVYPAIILFSGGRGGFVTLFIGLLLYIVTNKGKRFYTIGIASILTILLIFLGKGFLESRDAEFRSVMGSNTRRVFSYINDGGIDMSQTSGRDYVYEKSVEIAMEKPIFGHGLYGYKQTLINKTDQGYPHNLFLELFLQGGFSFLIFGIYLLFSFFVKLRKIVKYNNNMIMLLPLVIYPFTELMYTGSYMNDVLFWFCMMFVYNYKLPCKTCKMQKYVSY